MDSNDFHLKFNIFEFMQVVAFTDEHIKLSFKCRIHNENIDCTCTSVKINGLSDFSEPNKLFWAD